MNIILGDIRLHYPFYHRPEFTIEDNPWLTDSIAAYFEEVKATAGDDAFRISTVNTDYKVCDTYAPTTIVPTCANDNLLKVSSNFRQMKRFPVLSYFHAATQVRCCIVHSTNLCQAGLARCAQPLVGQTVANKSSQRRCKEDELLLNAYLDACNQAHRGYIVDLRSQSVAEAALKHVELLLTEMEDLMLFNRVADLSKNVTMVVGSEFTSRYRVTQRSRRRLIS